MNHLKWSKSEKRIARRAFDLACQREHDALAKQIKGMADRLDNEDAIWTLHDFLHNKRKEIGEKYDYRYSVLIFVFARLIREGWLDMTDLEGLSEDKIAPITTLVNM